MDIKSFREGHRKMLEKLYAVVSDRITIEYADGTKGIVDATLSGDRVSTLVNGFYVDRNITTFHVIKEDLIKANLPIKNFVRIIHNRIQYEVDEVYVSSTINSTIEIVCKVVG